MAWMINAGTLDVYLAYPFPVFPVLLSDLFGWFGLHALVMLKVVAALLYVFVFFASITDKSIALSAMIFGVFIVFLTSRGLDIRPEMLANVFMLIAIMLFGFAKPASDKILIACGVLVFASLAFSPRYLVPVLSFLVMVVYLRGKGAIIPMIWSGVIFLVFYWLVIGNPVDSLIGLVDRQDMRPGQSAEYKLSRIFGPRYLLPVLMLLVLWNIWKQNDALKRATLYLMSVGVYIGFILVFDKVPFEYASLPMGVLLFMHTQMSVAAREPSQASSAGLSLVRQATKVIGLAFMVVLTLYYAKNVRSDVRLILSYESNADSLAGMPIEARLFERDKLSPIQQIDDTMIFCEKYRDHRVYVTAYRWHPVCLQDDYSADLWSMRTSLPSVMSAFRVRNIDVKQISNGDDFLYLYRKKSTGNES